MPLPDNVFISMLAPPVAPPECASCDEPYEHAEHCACGCGVMICEHCRVRCSNCDDYYALGCTEVADWRAPIFDAGDIQPPRECLACAMAARDEVVGNLLKGLSECCTN